MYPNGLPSAKRIDRGPLFGGTWGNPASPGFGLEPSDMGRIAAHLPGSAVTVEHAGLLSAVHSLDLLDESVDRTSLLAALRSEQGARRPVGSVVEAVDDCGFVIHIDPELSGVASLVRNGTLRGVSLTTVANPGAEAEPVELTLCTDPARGMDAAFLSTEYIFQDGMLVKTAMEAAPTPAAAEKTPLEVALDSLPEEQRAVVLARLQEYDTKHTENTKALSELTTALKTRDAMLGKQETDKEVLLAQFDLLRQRLDGVEGVNLDGCREALQEPDRTQQMNDFTMGRIIEACSRGLQAQMKAQAAPAAPVEQASTKKRKVAAPDTASGEGLRNLLRSNF